MVDTPILGNQSAVGGEPTPWELRAVYYDHTDLFTVESNGGLPALELDAYPQTVIASGIHTSPYGVGEAIDVTFAADESQDRVAFFIRIPTTRVIVDSVGGPVWVDRYPSYPSFTYFGGGIIVTAPGDLFACLSC
jgi:hypothetical protein